MRRFYQKQHKYRAKTVYHNGIKFDSKREGDRYIKLKLMEKAGVIKDLKIQPKFELQPKFDKDGQHYRPIFYVADFQYILCETGKTIIEDSKGMKTQVYNLKKKMFEYKYKNLTIQEV